MPSATSPATTAALLRARRDERVGRDDLARRFAVSPSTASRLIVRAGLPAMHELDPVTGIRIRASRRTQHRYEHESPGSLIHVDVKKLGRIPDGGGWRAHGCSEEVRGRGIGYDYVHVAVDDHSRLTVEGERPNCRAMSRIESPSTRHPKISMRSLSDKNRLLTR